MMKVFAHALLCLTIVVFGVNAIAVDELRQEIISELKGYFDKELESLKRKHDAEIKALDAKLTNSQVEIADLKSQNELLDNGLRKVLFMVDERCMRTCQTVEDFDKQGFGWNKKIWETQTSSPEPSHASLGLNGTYGRKAEDRNESSFMNSSTNAGHIPTTDIKERQLGGMYRYLFLSYKTRFSAILTSTDIPIHRRSNHSCVYLLSAKSIPHRCDVGLKESYMDRKFRPEGHCLASRGFTK